MQRLLSLARGIALPALLQPSMQFNIAQTFFSTVQKNIINNSLLKTYTPLVNPICTMKVKGRPKRRCASCYFVFRQERLYIMCPKHPRHKQMSMVKKPHNTYILTHASQSKIRPW